MSNLSKFRSISLAIIISSYGFDFSQTATATIIPSQSPLIKPSIDFRVDVKNVATVALVKKCTIRRYRRPR